MKDDKIDMLLEISPGLNDSVGLDFADSVQSMAEAQKNGFKVKGRSMMMLYVMFQGTQDEGVYWNITGAMAEGKNTIIDAKAGKFIRLY